MIVSFNIEYRTNFGEEVRVTGSVPELGKWDQTQSLPLTTTDGIGWAISKEILLPKEEVIKYNYCIYRNGKPIRKEWNSMPRCLFLSSDKNRVYHCHDSWKNISDQQYFYSSAFAECLLARKNKTIQKLNSKKTIVIKACAPRIGSDYCLGMTGNQEVLGNWNTEKTCLMSDVHFPEWRLELDASKLKFPLEYKFVLYNLKKKCVESWEQNPNRYLVDPKIKQNETYILSDRYAFFDTPTWKGAGVAVPVFSLKSEHSFGVGDFSDLKRIIDWAVHTHQKLVQILPINDTTMTHTWTDSYPYNSISIYAFHPMYADLNKLGKLRNKEQATSFEQKQKELNTYSTIDYEEVNKIKWDYFRLIYKQEGEKVLASSEFRTFFDANKEWLQPYAVFSYLRDVYKTSDFHVWPRYTTYNLQDIEKMSETGKPDYDGIAIYYYIQFNLHLQLLEATTYARENGVVLKGDIPIGISRNSVEAWTEPHYFNLNGQAGAPPDSFSVNGQNWGFPTYNWDVMEKDGYRWWMKRFQKMAEYFDAYRIDHILGFFRIWEIPTHAVHGLLGQFSPDKTGDFQPITGM